MRIQSLFLSFFLFFSVSLAAEGQTESGHGTMALSYGSFQLNDQQELQSLKPEWKDGMASMSNINFSYQPQIAGLSIDQTNGELSFGSLAQLAQAGGRNIMVTVSDASGASANIDVPLQIKANNRDHLRELILIFFYNEEIGPTGDYNAIDTSQVEDMLHLFWYGYDDISIQSFNGDISRWDTSNVKNMWSVFYNLKVFNGDISNWDTSQATNMRRMFFGAHAFNQDISNWDVSKVENMKGMFWGASAFNQDISGWDTSSATTMRFMFREAASFDQDISGWDVSNVTEMSYMFEGAVSFNQDISSWDTANVKDMRSMFAQAGAFDQDISGWNVRLVSSSTIEEGEEGEEKISENGLKDIFWNATAFNRSSGVTETQPREYFNVLQN